MYRYPVHATAPSCVCFPRLLSPIRRVRAPVCTGWAARALSPCAVWDRRNLQRRQRRGHAARTQRLHPLGARRCGAAVLGGRMDHLVPACGRDRRRFACGRLGRGAGAGLRSHEGMERAGGSAWRFGLQRADLRKRWRVLVVVGVAVGGSRRRALADHRCIARACRSRMLAAAHFGVERRSCSSESRRGCGRAEGCSHRMCDGGSLGSIHKGPRSGKGRAGEPEPIRVSPESKGTAGLTARRGRKRP